MDGHERSNIVENRTNFLNQMEEIKSYVVEFYDDGAMKPKVYLSDCAMRGKNH